ncbi:uncharacterized protein [Antedon mediterranea]|uniref:uncharacterized protein n=1 Tax=Antedon mediterranea TaxID=105859 RepID=UPI003AF5285D
MMTASSPAGVCKEGCIAALGIPLLDMIANVTDDFLKRFNLEEDNSIHIGTEQNLIYEVLQKDCEVKYSAGGSAQNSIRISQLILNLPHATTIFGCIGKDKFGEILKQKGQAEGALVVYKEHDTLPTGRCAVLITNQHRSLCSDFSAAKHYTLDHLQAHWSYVEKASILYAPGYAVASSPDSVTALAHFAAEKDKLFCLNLSATYICAQFSQFLLKLIPYVDILFGSLKELIAFCDMIDCQKEKPSERVLTVCKLPKVNQKRNRIVVITQGEKPTILATGGKAIEYPVIGVPKEHIIDTCGAGDAFVGGFLSQIVLGQDYDRCILCGHYAASIAIQHTGSVIPNTLKFQNNWDVISQK